MDNIIELVVSFTSGIVVPLIPLIVKSRKNKKEEQKKDIVLSHLDIQIKNQEILDQIREHFNASRVSIMKFSNGTDFLDNTHMLNVTVVSESNDNGFHNIKNDFQRTPAYLLDRILNKLKLSNNYTEINSEVEDWRDSLVALRKAYGVSTVIGIKLVNSKGKWYGILFVSFEKERLIGQDDLSWLEVKSKQLN